MLIQNLRIYDFDENQHVIIPSAFQFRLFLCPRRIFANADLSRCEYLSDLQVPSPNANVGLLISCDYPQVIQPREVISRQNSGPFAYKTLLG